MMKLALTPAGWIQIPISPSELQTLAIAGNQQAIFESGKTIAQLATAGATTV